MVLWCLVVMVLLGGIHVFGWFSFFLIQMRFFQSVNLRCLALWGFATCWILPRGDIDYRCYRTP